MFYSKFVKDICMDIMSNNISDSLQKRSKLLIMKTLINIHINKYKNNSNELMKIFVKNNKRIIRDVLNKLLIDKKIQQKYIYAYKKNDKTKLKTFVNVILDDLEFDKNNVNELGEVIYNVLLQMDNQFIEYISNSGNILKLSQSVDFSNFIDFYEIENENTIFKGEYRLHFTNEKLKEVYGRKVELDRLYQFIKDDSRFLFTVITGPGGVGKSKLAYYFCNKVNKIKDWKALFLDGNFIEKLSRYDNYNYDKHILFVIDYVSNYSSQLYKLVSNIIEKSLENKIRIILIDRIGRISFEEENIFGEIEKKYRYPEWYNEAIGKNKIRSFQIKDIHRYLFDQSFIELKGLENDEDYYALIDQYVKTNFYIDLNILDKKDILYKVKKIYGKNPLPLYVLLILDIKFDSEINQSFNEIEVRGNLEKVLDYINKKNLLLWKDSLKNDNVYLALKEFLIYATMFGGWRFGEVPLEYLKEYLDILSKEIKSSDHHQIFDLIVLMSGVVTKCENTIIMKALEPDLIGEYFVSKEAEKWIMYNQSNKFKDVSKKLSEAYPFFSRGLQDHPKGIFPMIKQISNVVMNDKAFSEDNVIALLKLFYEYIKYNHDKRAESMHSMIQDLYEKYKLKSIEVDELLGNCIIMNKKLNGKDRCEQILELYNKQSNSKVLLELSMNILKTNMHHFYKQKEQNHWRKIEKQYYLLINRIKNEDDYVHLLKKETNYIIHIINDKVGISDDLGNELQNWNCYISMLIHEYINILEKVNKHDWINLKGILAQLIIRIINSFLRNPKCNDLEKQMILDLFSIYYQVFLSIYVGYTKKNNFDLGIIWHYGLSLIPLSQKAYQIDKINEKIIEINKKVSIVYKETM